MGRAEAREREIEVEGKKFCSKAVIRDVTHSLYTTSTASSRMTVLGCVGPMEIESRPACTG